ncbi:hypothetical protein MJO29_003206 [Puccinia striiformis f. sp. tritici]|uniref:Secreted protein n=1 Tax=Puccinia striiformis f. sp. tritici PST-78 TaxID=1165861 RepID=A0A0L0VHJ5_9BASI|nr:hypothetical protein MJO29_003206 [Puccinia striiformis f. sp. tritici]KAI9625061.1 hypothetical protein H4Q26_016448 [Puccinia striiformis f. sp. tritici PST-130]KAI9627063.1 hypothetical protein H4Q26_017591 [Puccinia striiformis f. sp. tritici PST-130]KNE98696.1 hypothetical protein PSTG_08064 [Puccinia striiformis f. sp. tritici PST-78]
MSIMNMFQRTYIAFAFLALSITLHQHQVEAVDIVTTECTYHFNRVGAVPGRASCQYNEHEDFSCNPNSCATKENTRFDRVYFFGCHAAHSSATQNRVWAAQYVRRKNYASVQDWVSGLWWDCPYNNPYHNNKQYLTCTDCYYVPPKP